MRRVLGMFLISFALPAGESHASPPCAESIAALRMLLDDGVFPLTWRETSMDDGKPMVLSILERNGALFLEFVKTEEGLWAEGASIVCRNGSGIEARIAAEKVRLGPAANWVARITLAGGPRFILTKVGSDQMRVATAGWIGTFSSRPPK